MTPQASLNDPSLIRRARGGDRAAAERLIEINQGLLRSIVRRFCGRGAEPEDLYQLACIGMLKAVGGFDESYGTQFSTYAVPKIIGEIRRFLRDDGMIKVSRLIKEDARAVQNARSRYEAEYGREPTLSEISELTGLSTEQIASAELSALPPDSLQRETGEDGLTLDGLISDGGCENMLVENITLREMMDSLPENERLVIALRYFKNMTQQQTARIAGVSQVQVSRIERRALEKLRQKMA